MRESDFFKVLDSVLRLEVSKGHLRWKISDVSRLSGVQRTLIYYYFGKSKENIVQTAMKTISEEFFGLSQERLELWRQGRISESVTRTRELFGKAPHLAEFYFHWRQQPSEIRDEFRRIEKRYLAKIKDFFPKLSLHERQALHAVFFGLVMIPDLDLKAQEIVLKRLNMGS
jgi:AcrR family transcriptional regulator